MIIDGEDGITHINIYSKGKTSLGRWLTNFSKSPFIIDGLSFQSVEGYWYWLLTNKSELQELTGFAAKQFGNRFIPKNVKEITSSEIFKKKICEAITIKLKSNEEMLSKLQSCNLPLCHYYVYGAKKVDAGYEWITEHIENLKNLNTNEI